MRVYISGPITGNPEYQQKFKEAEEKLKNDHHEVINPAEIGATFAKWDISHEKYMKIELSHEEYMQIDLALLGTCDAICMMDGWEESKGCNREYGFALGRGMKILEAGK